MRDTYGVWSVGDGERPPQASSIVHCGIPASAACSTHASTAARCTSMVTGGVDHVCVHAGRRSIMIDASSCALPCPSHPSSGLPRLLFGRDHRVCTAPADGVGCGSRDGAQGPSCRTSCRLPVAGRRKWRSISRQSLPTPLSKRAGGDGSTTRLARSGLTIRARPTPGSWGPTSSMVDLTTEASGHWGCPGIDPRIESHSM